MARYPTLEEYSKRGNYEDGIKRCDDLLKKSPNDVQLLTTKLQLCYASKQDAEPVLQQLLSVRPPILHLRELVAIEEAVWESQTDSFPVPKTAGPAVTKLWDNALKAFSAVDHKLDLLSLRFSRAIVDNRLVDAQQALIQLKALQPKNRVVYMAHAAVTQLLSSSKEDLSSRLALSLARKAITEKFDEDQSLDCRVPGQIFALQASTPDLESIKDRRFKESKQVHDALRGDRSMEVNGVSTSEGAADPNNTAPSEWLRTEVEDLKLKFTALIESSAAPEAIQAFALNSLRLFYTATTSIADPRGRAICDACFLSISAWIRLFEQTNHLRHLLIAAFLTETLLKQNTHIHEARLILIYLYMRLGLGRLAMQMFDSLRVKEIQYDTVGHALFTRLSLTHPHKTALSVKDSYDPLIKSAHALGVYNRHEEKLAESEASVLSHGQTGMTFDLHELREKLRSSMSRRIAQLEHRRICRLLWGAPEDDLAHFNPRVTANWLDFTDNRDFSETFDYGYNVEKVLHARNGAIPGRAWILYALAADTAWSMSCGLTLPVRDTRNLLQELDDLALDLDPLQINDSNASNCLGLTDAEYLAGTLTRKILAFYQSLSTARSRSEADFSSIIDQAAESFRTILQRLNIEALLRTRDIFTEHLQDFFVYLDVLRILAQPSKTFNAEGSKGSDRSAKIRQFHEHAKVYMQSLQRHAKEQVGRTDAAKIKEYMMEEKRVQEALVLFGSADLDDFCKSIATSGKEGWQGLADINVE